MKRFRPAVLLLVVVAAFGACGGDGGGDAQAFCDKQEEIDSIDASDPDAISEAIQEIAGDAPEEISDDMEVLSDALADLEGVDTPEEASEIMTDEIQEASENIEKWVDENCEEG